MIRALALLPLTVFLPTFALAAGPVQSGSRGDPRGDVPVHGDLLRASVSYNPRAGAIKAQFKLAAYSQAAAHRTVVGGFFARVRNGRCDTSSGALLTFETDTKVAAAGLASGGRATTRSAGGTVSGNTVRLTSRGAPFKGRRWNCVHVETLVPTGPTTSNELDKFTVRLHR